MRYPEFLKKNGAIGFVAPAFGCNTEPYKSAFDHSLQVWTEMGYHTVLGPNVYCGEGIGISNTPEKCGKELMEAWESKDTNVLLSCGGGEMMCEILDYLDFDRIKSAVPKWYMGYSDNTNFTFLLTTLADTAAIYGPCAPAFGQEPWHPALEDAYKVLTGEKLMENGYDLYEVEGKKDEEHPLEPYHVTEPRKIVAWEPQDPSPEPKRPNQERKETSAGEADRTIEFEGRLIGGCMDCLVNLPGTKYDGVKAFNEKYQEDGIIWFLEACDLNIFGIRRAIWQMQHAGWFEHVKGFLIGRPLCNGQAFLGLDQYRAVTDLLQQYQVPVIMDLDIGHIPPMMPIVSGAYAKVQLQRQQFTIEYLTK